MHEELRRITVALAAISVMPGLLEAGADCVDYTSYPFIMGGADTPGEAHAVDIAGTLACVADGPGGLQVVDISDPGDPSTVGGLVTSAPAVDVAFVGTHAYVVAGAVLEVIDVSAPVTPIVAGSLAFVDPVSRIAIAGDHAYLLDTGAMLVVDVSDPSSPALVTTVPVVAPHDLDVVGTLTYVATESGLTIVDIGTPALPSVVGSVSTSPRSCDRVSVSGDYAYVVSTSDSSDRVLTLDVHDPSAPEVVNEQVLAAQLDDVATSGAYALVTESGSNSGLHVLDLVDPAAPNSFTYIRTPDFAAGVACVDDLICVAGGASGMQTVDAAPPGAAGVLAIRAEDVAVVGTRAVVAARVDGLRVVDVSDPSAPQVLGGVVPGTVNRVAMSGDLVFAGTTDGLHLVDISDPTDPEILGSALAGESVTAVTALADVALVGTLFGGLDVVDVSDPTSPVLAHTLTPPSGPEDIVVVGTLAYVTSFDGIHVIDVTDPFAASVVGFGTVPGYAFDLVIRGDVAYVTDFFLDQLHLLDISDPLDPALVSTVQMQSYALGVDVVDHHAYVGVFGPGLVVVDVSDPMNPVILGSHRTDNLILDLVAANDHVYLANQDDLRVLPLQCESAVSVDPTGPSVSPDGWISLGPPRPSPAVSSFAVDVRMLATRDVVATLHDVAGRRVETLFEGTLDRGLHTLRVGVDGRPAGVYYLDVRAGGRQATERVVVMR